MCIFSRGVQRVSQTRIFARTEAHTNGARQFLVYAMNAHIGEPLAMVLPIPVVPGSGDDAVTFVDLSGYSKFFDDLDKAFETPTPTFGASQGLRSAALSPMLVVHRVGAFVASYVPHPRDFARLDERFRLPSSVLGAHGDYADWGFAVFQLAGEGEQTIHPMALSFPTRRPRAVFFPTLHVHDGATIPEQAHFDHTLTCQTSDEVLVRTMQWTASTKHLGKHVSMRRARGIVDGDQIGRRKYYIGDRKNADTWLDPPPCAGVHVLAGHGERFAFDLKLAYAYDAAGGAWQETSRTRIDDLHAGMMHGLTRLTTEHASDWQLEPFADRTQFTTLWLSSGNPFLFDGSGPQVLTAGTRGLFHLAISASTDRIETQTVDFVVGEAPSPETIAAMTTAFQQVLEHTL